MVDRDPAPPWGEWSQQQEEQFDLARSVLSTLVSMCSAQIAAASDPAERADLQLAQAGYARERRLLQVGDDVAVARVLRDYSPLARQHPDRGRG